MTEEKLPAYGGQALIEGVMMRGKNFLTAAMRAPDGEIAIHEERLTGIYSSPLKNVPFIRGLLMLWDSLVLGIRILTLSANQQTGENEKVEGASLYLTLLVSFSIAIGLFFLLPAAIGHWVQNLFLLTGFWGNLTESIVRLGLFVLYLWAIGKMPDIQRVFAYHGAEHKTINAYEHNSDLSVTDVKKYSVEHTRCGTSFILTVLVFSIILYSILGPMSLVVKLLSRVLLLPIIAGAAYEYIKWSANHGSSKIVQIIIKPNLWLQKLTTREPDEKIIEVALAAFNRLLILEDTVK